MSQKKYVFLDGIRGIAAIFALSRHTTLFWGSEFFRSYLAVDLFFILSGFVIAHAYDERLRSGQMTFKNFLVTRIIRLYPVYLLAILLCAVLVFGKDLFQHKVGDPSILTHSAMLLCMAMFLPFPLAGNPNLFPVNGPLWSIFFELVANFIYAAIRPWLDTRRLIGIIAISGLLVVFSSIHNGSLLIGYTWGGWSILGGFSRTIFGIFVGVLLFRKKDVLIAYFDALFRRHCSAWLAFFIIAAALASPSAGNLDAYVDLLMVAIVFPIAVLYLADGYSAKYEKVLLILGSASYPMYVLHLPLAQMFYFVGRGHVEQFAPLSGILLVIFLLWISLVVEKEYDIPLRRWLTQRFNPRSAKKVT